MNHRDLRQKSTSAFARRGWRVVLGVVLLGVAVTVGWYGLAQWGRDPPELADEVLPAAPPAGRPEDAAEDDSPDARHRRLAIGTWEDDYQGKRTLLLRPDGTGTMIVDLQGLQARLVAPRLTFNLRWAVHDGRLMKQTIDGEPATQVNLILKTMGNRVDEPILQLDDENLRLEDADGKTVYCWRRKG